VIRSKLVPLALATALSAIALAHPTLAAEPDPAFAAFTTVCGDPAADFTAVRTAADSHGWGASSTPPDPGMAGVTLADSLSKATTAGKTGLVLSAWQGATQKGIKVSNCAVHVAATDFDALRDAATAWLGFPAAETTPKKAVFRFTTDAGHRRGLAANEYDAAAAGAGLEILTVSGDANGSVVDLLLIKK
jgi:hypothetical protein